MIQSRRRFLGVSLLAVGSVTALMTAQSVTAWLVTPFRAFYHRLLSPTLEDGVTGPLNPGALNGLLAATRALLAVPVQIARYEDFFRWRSENVRGYKTLYEQFAAAVELRARQSAGCDFLDCSLEIQRKILANLPQVNSAETRWDKLRVSVLERDWVLFDRYIVREILLLFAKTDAWPLLGYEASPGTPRGLNRYTQAATIQSYVGSVR